MDPRGGHNMLRRSIKHLYPIEVGQEEGFQSRHEDVSSVPQSRHDDVSSVPQSRRDDVSSVPHMMFQVFRCHVKVMPQVSHKQMVSLHLKIIMIRTLIWYQIL